MMSVVFDLDVEVEQAERKLANLESESAALPIQLKSATQEANAARIHELRARAASIAVDLFSARVLALRLRVKSEEQKSEHLREQRSASERVLNESAQRIFAKKVELDGMMAEHGRLDFQHGLLENSYRLCRSELHSMKQELDSLIRNAGQVTEAA